MSDDFPRWLAGLAVAFVLGSVVVRCLLWAAPIIHLVRW